MILKASYISVFVYTSIHSNAGTAPLNLLTTKFVIFFKLRFHKQRTCTRHRASFVYFFTFYFCLSFSLSSVVSVASVSVLCYSAYTVWHLSLWGMCMLIYSVVICLLHGLFTLSCCETYLCDTFIIAIHLLVRWSHCCVQLS